MASRYEKAGRQGTRNWLVPANPKYFDLEQAFQESETLLWKQSSRVQVGDTFFLCIWPFRFPPSAIRVG